MNHSNTSLSQEQLFEWLNQVYFYTLTVACFIAATNITLGLACLIGSSSCYLAHWVMTQRAFKKNINPQAWLHQLSCSIRYKYIIYGIITNVCFHVWPQGIPGYLIGVCLFYLAYWLQTVKKVTPQHRATTQNWRQIIPQSQQRPLTIPPKKMTPKRYILLKKLTNITKKIKNQENIASAAIIC